MKFVFLFPLLLSFVFAGCSATVGSSLLVDSKSCSSASSILDANCSTTTSVDQTAIDIQPASTNLTVNMDSSDTVEVTGTCTDLGRKNNRIFVEAFAGDLNESVDPYVSNEIGSNCLNTSSGLAAGDKCFFVTQGLALTENAGQPNQLDFPRCHNGQFGFAVKLGKILTDAALGTNYLIRFKLRTGSLQDTAWNRVYVSRKLTTPKIDSTTVNASFFQCNIKTSLARFNQNITYTLNRTYNLLSGAASASIALPGFGATSASSGNYDYYDTGLVDGVTYNYTLTSTESQYAGLYPSAQTASSVAVKCSVPAPTISVVASTGVCRISLAVFNSVSTGIGYEIGASTTPKWTGVNNNAANAGAVGCSSGSIQTGNCQVNLTSGQQYYISVRAVGPGGEVGNWASLYPCNP